MTRTNKSNLQGFSFQKTSWVDLLRLGSSHIWKFTTIFQSRNENISTYSFVSVPNVIFLQAPEFMFRPKVEKKYMGFFLLNFSANLNYGTKEEWNIQL